MSFVKNTAIDTLIATSDSDLEWVPHSEITEIKSSQIDTVHYAIHKRTRDGGTVEETMMMLILLGSDEICTPTFVSEFSRIYSLPTIVYNGDVSRFRRYSRWLNCRNYLIKGFTKYDDKYYMVAHRRFYDCYSRYGFCSKCRILRCSPVWCICGHKQLSDGWTSNNKQLDEFIKKSQLQTNSPNHAYLEWIPFDRIGDMGYYARLYGLPSCHSKRVKLIPLEITAETHDLYYAELCDEHPDILTMDVWVTIGFTYRGGEYCLIKERSESEICLACTGQLERKINLFCLECKAPRLQDWTTGNKSLDSFIMASWKNTKSKYDVYIQWIEYSLLSNVQEMTLLRRECTHIADWLEPKMNGSMRVILKKIVDGQNAQSFDFYQLTEEYPEILTPDNIWVIGIMQEPSTKGYYLVFYHDIHAVLDRFIQTNEKVKYMQYADFDEIKEIGSGGYGTVYTAKYNGEELMPKTVVLKRSKSFDEAPELFIYEFRNHAKCYGRLRWPFLKMYGVTQDPETKEYIIVMQYANNDNLLSYLDQNINKLTWQMKLQCLKEIADYLDIIHRTGSVHCDLHGGNILLHNNYVGFEIENEFQLSSPYICDLGLSQSVNSHKSNSTIRGVLPFVAPEVFHTCKFTQKSDIYSFGIIMYLIATGEPPFRNRQFNRDLLCDILGGLRPPMPDSAPEEYKELAQRCCDADPGKRPDADSLRNCIINIVKKMDNSDDDIWNAVYHNDVRSLSRCEKENKYSSTLLPTGDLPKPRNSYDSVAVTQDFE